MHINNDTSTHQIKKITWVGIIINFILAAIKFIVGVLGSSQAVIADAFHSLSDMATDFAVIFGVRYWSAPPDEGHPYGHKRIETLITTTIGIAFIFVAIGLGYNALKTIQDDHISQTLWIAIVGPFLSIVFKEILYRRTLLMLLYIWNLLTKKTRRFKLPVQRVLTNANESLIFYRQAPAFPRVFRR